MNRTCTSFTCTGYRDWLGLPEEGMPQFLRLEEARAFVHSLGLQSEEDWKDWCKQGERPANIPAAPEVVYKRTGKWAGVYCEYCSTPNHVRLSLHESR